MKSNKGQYEQLTAYLDGELSKEQRAEVEGLLADDEEARTLLEELRRTSKLVASLPRGRAPSNLGEEVTARLEREALLDDPPGHFPAGKGWSGLFRGLAVAAALALVVTTGWLMFLQSGVVDREPITLAHLEPPAAPKDRAGTEDGLSEPGLTMLADAEDKKPAITSEDTLTETRLAMASPRDYDAPPAPAARSPERSRADAAEESAVASAGDARQIEGEELLAMKSAGAPIFPRKVNVGRSSGADAATGSPGVRDASGRVIPSGLAPRAAPETFAAGGFERRLATNLLTNLDLRRVPVDAFSNRVLVESDPEYRRRLLTHINWFMESNRIPDAQAQELPEPIQARQPFYLVKDQSGPARPPLETGDQPDEIQVVMNVPLSQAIGLITSMQQHARENRVILDWTANDVRLADEDAAPEVIRQLAMADRSGPPAEPRRAVNDRLHRGRGAQAKNEAAPQEKEDTVPAKRRASGSRTAGIGQTVRGERPVSGGISRGREDASTGPKAEDLVTLAILLRSNETRKARRHEPRQLTPETQQASPTATSGPSATSRPATQGTDGG
jgi:anti-sigma factor RsiW